METAEKTPPPSRPSLGNKENVIDPTLEPQRRSCENGNTQNNVVGEHMTPGAYSKLSLNQRVFYDNIPAKHKFRLSSHAGWNTTHKATSLALADWNDNWSNAPRNRTKQICNTTYEATGFNVDDKHLNGHVKRGEAGETPRFNKKSESHKRNEALNALRKSLGSKFSPLKSPVAERQVPRRKCEGIQPQKIKEIRYLIARSRRESATAIENLTDAMYSMKLKEFRRNGTIDDLASHLYQPPPHPKYRMVVEWDRTIYRSNDCTSWVTAASVLATQCDACRSVGKQCHAHVDRALSPGHNGEPISKYTNDRYITPHPESAQVFIGQLKDDNRALRKENARLRFEKEELQKMVTVDENSTVGKLVPKIMKAAQPEFEKQHKDDENMVFMWEIAMEHMNKVASKGGNMRGIRYHPLLLNFALMLLAKSSCSLYEEVREVFKLPALSYMQRLKKKKVGKQNQETNIFGLVAENVIALRDHFVGLGIPKDEWVVSLCFDSCTIKEGIQYDVDGVMTGCDIDIHTNVVANQFKMRVSLTVLVFWLTCWRTFLCSLFLMDLLQL